MTQTGLNKTGISSVPEVPEGWKILTNRQLFTERNERGMPDKMLLSVTQASGIVPQTDYDLKKDTSNEDKSNYKLVMPGDIVYNKMRMWQGAVGVSSYEGIVSPAYVVLQPREEVNARFYHYLFRTNYYTTQSRCNSYGLCDDMNSLRYEDFRKMVSVWPPFEKQNKIVEHLDYKAAQINRFIQRKQRFIELLKEQRSAIINEAVTKGINADVKMKDSGIEWLGEVPGHWEIGRLKNYCTIKGRIGFRGYTTDDQVEEGSGALTLGATHINQDGFIDPTSPIYISWEKYYESPEIMVSKNDILIVQRGSTCGKSGLVADDFGPSTINPSVVLAKNIQINPSFLSLFLQSDIIKAGVRQLVSETAIPMLSQFQIGNFLAFNPPLDEQQKIVNYVVEETMVINLAISKAKKEIELIKEYCEAVIAEAVMGKQLTTQFNQHYESSRRDQSMS